MLQKSMLPYADILATVELSNDVVADIVARDQELFAPQQQDDYQYLRKSLCSQDVVIKENILHSFFLMGSITADGMAVDDVLPLLTESNKTNQAAVVNMLRMFQNKAKFLWLVQDSVGVSRVPVVKLITLLNALVSGGVTLTTAADLFRMAVGRLGELVLVNDASLFLHPQWWCRQGNSPSL